jgi:phage-related minor tail protein
MADLNYTLSIEDQQALRSLRNVQAQTQKVSDTFRGLGTAIAAIATGAFAASTVQMATAMTNLSNSTGIALETIVGFGQAFTAAGGTIDRAADGISDLVKNVGEAAKGSTELQNAFGSVGVSLNDLGTLSEQDILRKTIAGLAALPDSATRTATGFKILGESIKGVDIQRLNRDLNQFTQNAGGSADGIRAAAEAQKNFSQAISTLQIELLKALNPITKVFNQIAASSEAIGIVVKAILTLVATVAALTAWGRIVGATSAALRTLAAGAETLQAGALSLSIRLGNLGKVGAYVSDKIAGIGVAFSNLITKSPALANGIAYVGTLLQPLIGVLAAAGVAFKLFSKDADDAANNESAAETKRLKAYNDRAQAAIDAKNRVVNAHAEEKKAINDGIRAMQIANSEIVRRTDLQTGLLRATEEQRFAVETTQEAEQNYLKAIEPLLAKIQAIREQGNKATSNDIALLPVLQQGIVRITKEYEAQVPALREAVGARIQEMQVAKELEIVAARLTKQAEDRAAVETAVRDIILTGQQRINDTYNEAAQVSLPGIYGQLRRIADEENRIAEAAKRRVAEQMGDDTSGLDQALAEITAASEVIIQQRQEAAYSVSEQQNSFTAGWARAFAEYAATATNAATQAQNIFGTVTKGIEDAFVNFAKTGKLSVKDLFKSIVETILRSQVQNLLARTFAGAGGGGGGSFLGNLFSAFLGGGRSAGGPVSAGRAYTVGESGPETFVPAGAGSIVPGGGATMVTYNINAVDAASFRSLVASDPEFMFAVTEQGRKRMPNNRR